MVLVVTNRDDLTADWLIVELRKRGAAFIRFNTEDYPYATTLSWTPGGDGELGLPETRVRLSDIHAVWFRRPVEPHKSDGEDGALAEWVVREAREALDGLWRSLDARWVNAPHTNQLAGCKPEQLVRASRLGLEPPASLITNKPAALREFASVHGPTLVCKPLYEGFVPSPAGNRVFWTSEFVLDDSDALDDLGGEPYLLQALVPKRYDIRVTVIGDEAFAVGIGSQSVEGSRVDWRRGEVMDLEHWVEPLPGDITHRCVELVHSYDLSFGAIDLARRADGGYTFFELNPNGQWAWLEQRTGIPLRARLVDLLTETS